MKPNTSQRQNSAYETKFLRGNDPDDYNDDEEEVLDAAYVVHKDTTASTERTVRKLEETKQIGVNINRNLKTQSEQLDHIEKDIEKVNDNVDSSQSIIQGILSLPSALKNGFVGLFSSEPKASSSKSPKDSTETTPTSSSGRRPLGQLFSPTTTSKERSPSVASASSSHQDSRYASTIGQKGTRFDEETKKQNANLELMGNLLSDIRGASEEMGKELNSQSEKIDRITNRTDDANTKLLEANRMLRKANN